MQLPSISHFKGTIHYLTINDIRFTFFPLDAESVNLENAQIAILPTEARGVVGIDACESQTPCFAGQCENSDISPFYQCQCTETSYGSRCENNHWCYKDDSAIGVVCPNGVECNEFDDHFTCDAELSFNGETSLAIFSKPAMNLTSIKIKIDIKVSEFPLNSTMIIFSTMTANSKLELAIDTNSSEFVIFYNNSPNRTGLSAKVQLYKSVELIVGLETIRITSQDQSYVQPGNYTSFFASYNQAASKLVIGDSLQSEILNKIPLNACVRRLLVNDERVPFFKEEELLVSLPTLSQIFRPAMYQLEIQRDLKNKCRQKDEDEVCFGRGEQTDFGYCLCDAGFLGNDCENIDYCFENDCLENEICYIVTGGPDVDDKKYICFEDESSKTTTTTTTTTTTSPTTIKITTTQETTKMATILDITTDNQESTAPNEIMTTAYEAEIFTTLPLSILDQVDYFTTPAPIFVETTSPDYETSFYYTEIGSETDQKDENNYELDDLINGPTGGTTPVYVFPQTTIAQEIAVEDEKIQAVTTTEITRAQDTGLVTTAASVIDFIQTTTMSTTITSLAVTEMEPEIDHCKFHENYCQNGGFCMSDPNVSFKIIVS